MRIPVLGPLRPHSHIREWLVSDPIPIPLFDGQVLPVVLEDPRTEEESEVEKVICAFLKLDRQDRLAISRYVFANYRRIAELVTAQQLGWPSSQDCEWYGDFPTIETEDAVWQHVQPQEIYISRRGRRDCDIYVSIAAECSWEPEHGLQIVYRRGSVLVRVSDQDGHLTHTDAYDLPEDQDKIVD